MKPTDYSYDYPENRRIGKYITFKDIKEIALSTGYNERYVYQVFKGTRKNKTILNEGRKRLKMHIESIRKEKILIEQ